MRILSTKNLRSHEFGLEFKDDEFRRLLSPGRHWFFDPLNRKRVDVMSCRTPWIYHEQLDMVIKSGVLEGRAEVLDLQDHERALVWIDGRFARVLTPGLHALWTGFRDIRVERFAIGTARFEHKDLHVILSAKNAPGALDTVEVPEGHEGLYLLDGSVVEILPPGTYAFWKGVGGVKVHTIDRRESLLDIGGQEIMTADKVSLRLNAVVTYRVVDVCRAVTAVGDPKLALYRDAQLALRAVVGGRELDALLSEKDVVTGELERGVRRRAEALGMEIVAVGIRDVILPGEMKTLLNKVTEARKAAEANLVTRREETAAMRSQANTAKMLENNPTLMRLRELEVLQSVAGSTKMSVVLGEKGLADRVMNLL